MTGPLSDQQLDEATALLARLDAVPSVGYLDSADLGWVRPVLHDLLDEIRRLRGEVGRLKAERAGWRSIAGVEEIEAERDELRARIGNARSEIRTQDTAATIARNPGFSDVCAALAAVETHLVDPEHRPAERGAAP